MSPNHNMNPYSLIADWIPRNKLLWNVYSKCQTFLSRKCTWNSVGHFDQAEICWTRGNPGIPNCAGDVITMRQEVNCIYAGIVVRRLFHLLRYMMTSSNGNIFRVTGPLCGEFPLTKASDAELWCFLFNLRLDKRLSKQSRRWWFEAPSSSLWRHCNNFPFFFQNYRNIIIVVSCIVYHVHIYGSHSSVVGALSNMNWVGFKS